VAPEVDQRLDLDFGMTITVVSVGCKQALVDLRGVARTSAPDRSANDAAGVQTIPLKANS
jgi:hypothetical protein